ncbi:hypothetical protein KC330_g8832 [Hortaea werneckii]|nr:hypothetical protein KC330_g8832 [Hortaea werneckii]
MAPKKRKAEVDHGPRKKAAEESTTRRITRGMTTDAARRAVFETAELLENIVIQLPPRKIFVIQRVCKQFRDIVATSVKLQQRLFLRADGCEAQEWKVAAKSNVYDHDSDLPTSFRFVRSTDILEAEENVQQAFKPVRLSHMLQPLRGSKSFELSRGYHSPEQFAYFRWSRRFCAEALLAKTYLTSPPAQQAYFLFDVRHKSDSSMVYSVAGEVKNSDGLKAADIMHAIRSSKSLEIRWRPTVSDCGRDFKDVSLENILGNKDFFEKTEIHSQWGRILLPGCIAPTEEEWAAMAG